MWAHVLTLATEACHRSLMPSVYCSSSDYYDCDVGARKLQAALEPLLRHHRVDLGLYGHIHSYERTLPVFGGAVTAKSYAAPNATTHLVVGMAGDVEGLTNTWTRRVPDWSAVRNGVELGYGRLDFRSASELHFSMIGARDAKVIDEFTITK